MQNNPLTILLIALAVFFGFVLYKRSAAAQTALATPTSTGAAGAADTIANTSGSVLNKVPYIGGPLDKLLNKPVTNVTSGDVKGTIGSALTGGLSDFVPKLNPTHWF